MIHAFIYFAVSIKVPAEVAVGIGVVAVVLILMALGGEAAQRLRARIPSPVVKWLGLFLGLLMTGAGLFLITSFLTETVANNRQHLGVPLVDEVDALSAALLVAAGAACLYWGRWTRSAAVFAPIAAIALILKPFVWPLQFYETQSGYSTLPYGSRPVVLSGPLDPFAETHLFFLLSGVGLLALAVLLLWRARTPPR
ncbi:MAG: hypothetical protein ACI9KE_000124 [Polyangiales bacterium]|jgi:hypothetical protein